MPSIDVPQGYSYVLAAAMLSVPLSVYQGALVGKWRRISGIRYPRLYASVEESAANPNAHIFNCAQRAHQNTLESLPHVLLSILVTGLKYPKLATSWGVAWFVGRILYTIGYTTGVPANRNKYSLSLPTITGLGSAMCACYTVLQFVKEGL